jgi:hypothetical protein
MLQTTCLERKGYSPGGIDEELQMALTLNCFITNNFSTSILKYLLRFMNKLLQKILIFVFVLELYIPEFQAFFQVDSLHVDFIHMNGS